jgi:hypothetical protein
VAATSPADVRKDIGEQRVARDNSQVPSALKRFFGRLRSGGASALPATPAPERPSPPSPGFLGARIRYRDSNDRRIYASCVDVSTDWVALFDVEVVDRGDKVVESYRGVRGYTALHELAESRGWTKVDIRGSHRDRLERQQGSLSED